jgi:membrane-associated phospholipid phosphatase
MRAAEVIHIVVFTFFAVLAWLRPLPPRRRAKVTAISIGGMAATIIAALWLPRIVSALAASVVRDWLPATLVLLVYWQTGNFFTAPDQGFQDRLERIDERIVGPMLRRISHLPVAVWLAGYLELAYLLCYAMVPMSMGVLYLLRLGQHADSFWTVVLISTYISYGALPFVQTLPPRVLAEPWLEPLPSNPVRRFNLWILRHASIHANTFPSAHVAASTGAALVLTSLAPWPVGLVFSAIALGIGIGTFAGRYHYASDSVAGCVVAAIVFAVTRWLQGF